MAKKLITGILTTVVALQLAAAEKWGEFSFSDSQLGNKYVADFKKWNEQEKDGGFGSDTVLCIGSSSMRGWNTIHRDLAPLKVIHRGFGGSSMGQVLIWKNFFLRYPSDTVLMYEGDNDMVNPRISPQMFIERYQEFCGDLILANPDVQIYILSVKPSIARWNLWPRMKACNELLKAYAEKEGHVTYIDVASAMLGDDGKPREELLSPKDKLHMTPAGYALWTERVRSFLLNKRELNVRGAVPNFQKKLAAESEVRVAYLGGSITMASGWRVGTTAWLREKFPGTKITEINSAIAGTGAGFGACRLYEHVLKENPDLIFVEFRVNGGDNSMARTIEGLVRQVWAQQPETDIVFVYTISSPMIDEIRNGTLPGQGGCELEQVAEHYGIPSIDFGPEIVSRIDNGSLIFKGTAAEPGKILFSGDGVHPGTEGHAIYTDVIKRSFEKLFTVDLEIGPHSLPAVLSAGCWEQGGMVDVEPYLRGDWKTEDWQNSSLIKAFQALWGAIECERIVPAVSQTKTPGSALEFVFEGTVFGFFDIGGPETGSVRITIDDETPYEVSRFNRYCYRYRPQYYLSKELPEGRHKVRIELSSQSVDKKSIVGEERYNSNQRFEYNVFCPVKILLNGKIAD